MSIGYVNLNCQDADNYRQVGGGIALFDKNTYDSISIMAMADYPLFPVFKPIELGDRGVFQEILRGYQPTTSEWTFTNLFIWQSYYKYEWSLFKDMLFVVGRINGETPYALQPMGLSPRKEGTITFLEWLAHEKKVSVPCIERADERLVFELDGVTGLFIKETREHFDYVYLREDLSQLSGNRYRSKRNHINQVLRNYTVTYDVLDDSHIPECLAIQEKWCRMRRCEDDLGLIGEWDAVRVILSNFDDFGVNGGVTIIGGEVVAFSIGEPLNGDTAVIHIEKADPDMPGLFQVINHQFCQNTWGGMTYINREQDLGIRGLREAKMSYYPHHFVKKYSISLI